MLGGHVIRRPSQPDRRELTSPERPTGEVEVEDHRLAVAREQGVRWLDVHVQEAAIVGVLEAVGEASDDPADRLDVGGPGEIGAERSASRPGNRQGLLDLVHRFEELAAVPFGRGTVPEPIEDLGESRAPEIGHAEEPEVSLRENLLGIQRNNVHVLESGQREVFLVTARRHLQDDRPVGQRRLGGQEYSAKCTPAQHGQQLESFKNLAHFREIDGGTGRRFEELVAGEEDFQFGPPLREAPEDLRRVDLKARFLAETYLLVDQADGEFVAELGVTGQELLGSGAFPALPGGRHLLNLLGRE